MTQRDEQLRAALTKGAMRLRVRAAEDLTEEEMDALAAAAEREIARQSASGVPQVFPTTGLEPRGCPTPGACSCPVRQPASEAEIEQVVRDAGVFDFDGDPGLARHQLKTAVKLWRAYEAHHGIGREAK